MYQDPLSRDLLPQIGSLHHRHALLKAATYVERLAVEEVQILYLRVYQLEEVRDVQEVSYLLAGTAIAEVAQLASEVVTSHPEGEDALVHLTHLPGPRYYPATVYDGFYPVGRPVLLDEHL